MVVLANFWMRATFYLKLLQNILRKHRYLSVLYRTCLMLYRICHIICTHILYTLNVPLSAIAFVAFVLSSVLTTASFLMVLDISYFP